jgi:hypothetical protein
MRRHSLQSGKRLLQRGSPSAGQSSRILHLHTGPPPFASALAYDGSAWTVPSRVSSPSCHVSTTRHCHYNRHRLRWRVPDHTLWRHISNVPKTVGTLEICRHRTIAKIISPGERPQNQQNTRRESPFESTGVGPGRALGPYPWRGSCYHVGISRTACRCFGAESER